MKLGKIISAVIIAALFALLLSKLQVLSTMDQKVSRLVKKCQPQTNTSEISRTDCLLKGYESLVTRSNFSEVVMSTKNAYADKDCHTAAHIVAKIAYEKGATFSDILNKCTNMCGYGCLHGAFQSRFESNLKGFIENIGTFCNDIPEGQTSNLIACWHIVGHGVGEYYGKDIGSSINTCASLPEGLPSWHCLNGLVMEYIEPFPWTPKLYEFTPELYLSICAQTPASYRTDCYGSAAYSVLKATGSVDDSVAICKKVPQDSVIIRKCAAEAGGTFALMRANPKDTYSYCERFGNLKGECILSAVVTFASGDFPDKAAEICGYTDGALRGECFANLGSGINSGREAFCSKLGPDNESCLKNPTDDRNYLLPSYLKE